MTQSGVALELPKQVHHTKDLGCSSLPTPTVSDQYTGNLASTQQKLGSMHSVTLAQVFHKPDLFPTPVAADWKNGRPGDGYGPNLPQATVDLMPTPTTRDYKDGSEPHERDGKVQTDTVARAVFNSGEVLLKTPIAKEGLNGNTQTTSIKKGQLWLSNDVQDIALDNGLRQPNLNINLGAYESVQWGKFEPAIRRWEAILGRPAPEPTKPDGKEKAHRLSSKFTEWMMGLPDGWITGHDLKRNDELKLAGNGVVPQQAELALRLLLELPERKENNNE
jgi:hypothetical protein